MRISKRQRRPVRASPNAASCSPSRETTARTSGSVSRSRSTASAARSPTSAPASARSPSAATAATWRDWRWTLRQRLAVRGHVAPDRQQQRAGLGLDDPPAHLAHELAAVAAQPVGADREPQRVVGREVELHVARVALAQALRPQHLHGLAQQLVVFVAEQRLGVRVGEHDPAVAARGHGRVREALEHGAQRGLAAAQPILQARELGGRRRRPHRPGPGGALPVRPDRRLVWLPCPGSAASLRTFTSPEQWGVDPIAMDRTSSRFPPAGREEVAFVPCEAPPSDRRMDSTGGRGGTLARGRRHRAARPQARERPDRDREPSRPGGCSHPAWRPRRRCPGASRRCCSPGAGKVEGRYLRSTPETVHWGALPGPRERARRRPSTAARWSPSTPSRTRASWRTRAATRSRSSPATASRASKVLNDAKALAASVAGARRPVRRQRPGRRARRRAGRHPARSTCSGSSRASPYGVDLQPPRQGHQPRRLDLHAGAPRRGGLPRAAARRAPARPLPRDHGRRGRQR